MNRDEIRKKLDEVYAFLSDAISQHKDSSATNILKRADELVNGPRQENYGPPSENYARAAKLWSAILGVEITPVQVVLCMIGIKMAREVHKHTTDNLVDIVGYALLVEMLHEKGE